MTHTGGSVAEDSQEIGCDRPGNAKRAQGVSVDAATTRELLIFDQETGVLLAWEQIERPTETVAGTTLFLGYNHTDRLG